ncbi:MAG: hypothetical protein PHW76_09835 [Alphaproteobacteria bacterium]|nr:hypothetical protein [Alphaproteobacteria bacterium]
MANSFFTPKSCLKFLSELAEGTHIADCGTESLLGIDYRTHLNILGRIKVGQIYIKDAEKEGFYAEDIKEALNELVSFEGKFSTFLQAHSEEIDEGLKQYNEKQETKIPLVRWHAPTSYFVGKALPYARFDHKDRDLRNDPSDDTHEQKSLRTAFIPNSDADTKADPTSPTSVRRFMRRFTP